MTEIGGIDTERLMSLIERIERLEEEKQGIQADIRDIYAEAKNSGYDTKAMKTVIKLRKMSEIERQEQDFLVEKYMEVCGL